ncbi:MAG: hypothetical protein LBS69_06020 [Prevotellaceae bacterium]|jgi:hypothetical protein|nr:hypothetical protein [Prevotellaceae bacterium]
MVKKRLTKEAIFKMTHPKRYEARIELSQILGFTSVCINKKLRQNKWNGTLTTETALLFLEKELEMSRSQILETAEDEEVEK